MFLAIAVALLYLRDANKWLVLALISCWGVPYATQMGLPYAVAGYFADNGSGDSVEDLLNRDSFRNDLLDSPDSHARAASSDDKEGADESQNGLFAAVIGLGMAVNQLALGGYAAPVMSAYGCSWLLIGTSVLSVLGGLLALTWTGPDGKPIVFEAPGKSKPQYFLPDNVIDADNSVQ